MAKEDIIKYSDEWVLIADDEESLRVLVLEMLSHLDFRADSVENGDKALKRLENNPYTILLTDIKMPGIDGLELIKVTRSRYPDLCAIAMTGYTKEYSYVDVVKAGATDFINKPFGIEELEAKMRRAITERNTRQELSKLSITDSLTGLYNRRHFYDRLNDEIARAQRLEHKLSLMLLDLDNFKQYNDTRGHLAGDELLERVGDIIKSNIRLGVDSGYRYGGDEFGVILVDADEKICKNIGTRIEETILDQCHLGLSMGYADFLEGMTPETLVIKADQDLYGVKNEKKDKRQ
ncbi:MAG: diguanylate cyclase [Desulfobacteraceae bacterium]|nr:diguanylate cyclase [Desulfobacteraceae bacterium]